MAGGVSAVAAEPRYDLLVRAEHVLDPGRGIDGPLDIAIVGGRIAAVAQQLAPSDAIRTIDVRGPGRYVLPGLIDMHAHVAVGATTPGLGIAAEEPDRIGVASGVTTVSDGGSVGVGNIGAFPLHILPQAVTRIVVFANVGTHAHTLPGVHDIARPDDIDPAMIETCVTRYPGLVRGFKLRLTGPYVETHGEDVIARSLALVRAHGLPLMVHIGYAKGDPSRMRELTRHLLRALGPGDILTHTCTVLAGNVLDEGGAPLDELADARVRGVFLDSASGRQNFTFAVARALADRGIRADAISTDMTVPARAEIVHSLLECMAKFLTLGYELDDVVRMTTAGPAHALRMSGEIGAIAPGREADLSVIDVVSGKWRFVDSDGAQIIGDLALVPVQTIRRGALIAPDWGPYRHGWLPPEA